MMSLRKRLRLYLGFATFVNDEMPAPNGVSLFGLPSDSAQGDFLELDDLSPEVDVYACELLVEIVEGDFLEPDEIWTTGKPALSPGRAMTPPRKRLRLDRNLKGVHVHGLPSDFSQGDFHELDDLSMEIDVCSRDLLVGIDEDHLHFISKDNTNNDKCFMESNNTPGNLILINKAIEIIPEVSHLIRDELEQEGYFEIPLFLDWISCENEFLTKGEHGGSPRRGLQSYVAEGDFLDLDDLGQDIDVSAGEYLVKNLEIVEGDFLELDDLHLMLDVNVTGLGIENDFMELDDTVDHPHFIGHDMNGNFMELNDILGCIDWIALGYDNQLWIYSEPLPSQGKGLLYNGASACIATKLSGYKTGKEEAKLAHLCTFLATLGSLVESTISVLASPSSESAFADAFRNTSISRYVLPSDAAQVDFLELDDLSLEIDMYPDELFVEGDFLELDDLKILDVNANGFQIQSMIIEDNF